MRTPTTMDDAARFKEGFRLALSRVLQTEITTTADKVLCELYELMSRRQKYGIFSHVAYLMSNKT